MDKFLRGLFSMGAMALAMMVFFVAIGWATFIESEYGIQAAKIKIYNAKWFEILLAFLAVNLIANIVRYKMWKREKMAMLAFHVSFIVILIGAGITRFTGFEGIMLIREGQSSNIIHSSDPYLYIYSPSDQGKQGMKLMASEVTDNDFTMNVDFRKQPVKIEYVDFMSKRIDTLVIRDSIKTSALDIVTNGKKSNYLVQAEVFELGSSYISFEGEKVPAGINVYRKNGILMMKSTSPIQYLAMAQMQEARKNGTNPPDSAYKTVAANTEAPFLTTTLYMMGGEQFVFKSEIQHAGKAKVPSGKKNVGSDYLVVRISSGKEAKTVTLQGGMGVMPTPEYVSLNGITYALEYGAKRIDVPFSVRCNDFIIQRYPGSDVASSYASDLQILDSSNNYFKEKRVFMNNVIDYNGYRFFQSGFDEDEKGTRLSVNHDDWGTNVTYLGYLLMSIGMILSLFAPAGRFRDLIRRLSKSGANRIAMIVILFSMMFFNNALAQNIPMHDVNGKAEHNHAEHEGHDHEGQNHEGGAVHDESHTVVAAKPVMEKPVNPVVRYMSEEHSNEISKLLVQDFDGRIVPLHTVCDQLLRKIYRGNKYEKHNAVQTIMSMHMYRDHWRDVKIIQVPSAVREKYKLGEYASFNELSNENIEFKWLKDYNEALRKPESGRDETQKKLIKLVEKYEVVLAVFNWSYLKIIPVKNDPKNLWVDPYSYLNSPVLDTAIVETPFLYFSEIHKASADNNYRMATKLLGDLKAIQQEIAPDEIMPSETKVNMEISYNKMTIFKNVEKVYILVGFVMLIVFIFSIISYNKNTARKSKTFDRVQKVGLVIIILMMLYHGVGLGLRWYISGHVPWSTGYEALVYIALILVMLGIALAKFHPVIPALAVILAYCMLFVSDMNLLDPEITPLQPVLKSYWLMIHVSIITASYAFLGLSCMIGLVNLILYLFRPHRNFEGINVSINVLTNVSEMTMTIGLFMLTIGTFLGGIWANESWGRYWGWDPKETWALVSVLVYAIILHLRFIPGLKGKFTFNLVSFWGYSAILFTFFGVNFILVGLHSYAQGDGAVSLPVWVVVMIICFAIMTVIAAIRNFRFKKQQKQLL